MRLRHFYLGLYIDDYLEELEKLDELVTPFSFQTRYVCNFIERYLKKAKFNADGFSKMCICGRAKPTGKSRIQCVNALVVEVGFDVARYHGLSQDEFSEFFLSMIQAGIEKGSSTHSLPKAVLLDALENFRESGYKNCWIHKAKKIPNTRIKATLECKLTINDFSLCIVIAEGVKILHRECILQTKPDEIIFQHQFKEIVCTEGKLAVIGKFGKELWSMPLQRIGLK
jgi:hypothetical protein